MDYSKIDEHMDNKFKSEEKVIYVQKISNSKINNLPEDKIYKINIISLAVDIVESKKTSENYGPKLWSKIISEFIYGIEQIILECKGKWIVIQGDAIKCIFNLNEKDIVYKSLNCARNINTFINHLNKKIKSEFPKFYEIKIGIDLWLSRNNYISMVGIEENKDAIFIGKSVNYSSLLADYANRGKYSNILFNTSLKNSIIKNNVINQNKVKQLHEYKLNSQFIWGCNFTSIEYDNYINKNIK